MTQDAPPTPTNTQALANFQGDKFHREAIDALQMAGFEIVDQHYVIAEVGIEVDCIANNYHGLAMPWEFKGSWQGDRPGLRRTDTLKKAISSGYLFTQSQEYQIMTPLLVMTTHFPLVGAGVAMLNAVRRTVILAFVDSRDSKLLRWLCSADEKKIRNFMSEQATLFGRN